MGRAEAVQACWTWLAMYPGMLAPSQMCSPRKARRRSGGVVITTYAAATPAEMSTRFATVRALALVMGV